MRAGRLGIYNYAIDEVDDGDTRTTRFIMQERWYHAYELPPFRPHISLLPYSQDAYERRPMTSK